MKRGILITAAIVCCLAVAVPALATSTRAKIEESIDVMNRLASIPERTIPPALLAKAEGVAIIPGVIRAGFILGGRYGQGVLLLRENGRWSDPVFITLTGGSIGWQIGVESVDVILVFKTKRSVEGILRGKFTLGADAGVAAGPVGREASAATDVQLKAEVYSYSRSRGLFAGLAIQGSALQVDDEADAGFYGKEVTPHEIARGEVPRVPESAARLKKLIADYEKKNN
ncbi:MAG: lipid-binding SYLF domain-containing protein [Nitrospiraceae bacterium]|nr:lipid-binding SYLF domain-containing protein [Nitrospiraceae bacterium]